MSDHLHNNPPVELPTQVHVMTDLAQRHAADLAQARAWVELGKFVPPVIELEDTACLSQVAAYVKGVRAFAKSLDTTRLMEKRALDELAEAPQLVFRPSIAALLHAQQAAEKAGLSYNQRKDEAERKKAAEAAARAREEANRTAAAAAALETQGLSDVAEAVLDHALNAQASAEHLDRQAVAPGQALARTHTEGGTVSATGAWVGEISDHGALRATLGPLGDHLITAHLEQAIRAFVAAGKKAGRIDAKTAPVLAGVTFTWNTRAIFR